MFLFIFTQVMNKVGTAVYLHPEMQVYLVLRPLRRERPWDETNTNISSIIPCSPAFPRHFIVFTKSKKWFGECCTTSAYDFDIHDIPKDMYTSNTQQMKSVNSVIFHGIYIAHKVCGLVSSVLLLSL